MTGASSEQAREQLFEIIDREAADDAERSDSKVIYDALRSRQDELGGARAIPAEDQSLSERIHQEAVRRSEELRASKVQKHASSRLPFSEEQPLPVWLIIAWVAAVLLGGVLLYLFW